MRPAEASGRLRRRWWRISHFHGKRLGQNIPPLETIEDAIDGRVASGASEQAATLATIEDFERSAASVTARTTPLVPASGIIVAGAGILTKEGGAGAVIAVFALLLALIGVGFLATSLFTHAGRPSVGLPPQREDIAFVHDRLVRKESNAQVGSFFTILAFLFLVITIV
jgi:hypothetical protein